jgi:transposase-like protein
MVRAGPRHEGPHDNHVSDERRRKIVELYFKWGITTTNIAERFGVNSKTVAYIVKAHRDSDGEKH